MHAAKGGNDKAQFILGQMYTQKIIETNESEKVKQEYTERAEYWLNESYKQGNINAIVKK